MTGVTPREPDDSSGEIAALIETLHHAGQRLEQLTGGEVDTVANRDGQTFLLRLLSCDEMRGFLFRKPVPSEVFEAKFLTS